MSMLKALGIVLVAFVGLVFIVGACTLSGYKKAIRLDEGVNGAWSQVENQLQRRYDLIPNLVETVKGYAEHEKELFENIAQARTKYFNAGTPAERMQASGRLEGFLSRLLVLREQYPELKANQNFLQLQAQLEGTENRLSVERKRYNDAVRVLNTYVREPWGRFCSGLAGVDQAEYFEAAEGAKEAPKVDFGGDD
ncbi:MAG: LemA family protein [Phycisphaerales bacterium]|nr:MAG: LemA family protein [Phycisphaerales bacterium]